MIYVVDGPGRTGSKLLIGILACLHRTSVFDEEYYKTIFYDNPDPSTYKQNLNKFVKGKFDNSFIHTHYHFDNISKFVEPNEVTMVLSKRRNTFEQIMSEIVAREFDHWTDNSPNPNIILEPFEISYEIFSRVLRNTKRWEETLPMENKYAKCVTVDYEDMVLHGYTYVAQQVGIEIPSNVDQIMSPISFFYKKSILNYKDYVTNWQQLFEMYQQDNI
jgi:hypothetical protein